MNSDRRRLLKGGALAALGSGFVARLDRVAAAQKPVSLTDAVGHIKGDSTKLLLEPQPGVEGPPAPATDDRLSLEWNRNTVARLKNRLAEREIEAFLVRNPLNIIYLTGYWHTTTERPQGAFMNKEDRDPWFLYPSLDRDLVTTWWFGSGRMYFDFHHADGGYPEQGKVQQGKKVDLFRFMLEGIKEHGIQGKRIGVDGELYPSEIAKAKEILPGIEWIDISEIVGEMRQVKTDQELALWRRAYVYFDRAHAFARDYILTFGTDITDYEVAVATELWANDQLYSDLNLAGGQAHYGVGSGVGIGVRAGPVTAYPHPNQPYYNRIGKNMALQVAGIARVGGYGHECYRPYIIADSNGKFDAHMRKLWEVSRHCCDLQMTMSVEGVTCSHVAYEIHKYQVAKKVQPFVYHRPAHGAGVEGHQAPYLALGDYTMMRRNMCFSEEPGLYDPDAGCGFNWSDTVVVGKETGYRMSRVPYTEEWCWIKL